MQEAAARAATHEESRPENEHDTRAVEASYLAAGQAMRYEDLRKNASILKQFPWREFSPSEPIAIGALVELSLGKDTLTYLLAPVCGGYKVEISGKPIHIITAESKLGQALLDKYVGDEVEIQTRTARNYEIRAIS